MASSILKGLGFPKRVSIAEIDLTKQSTKTDELPILTEVIYDRRPPRAGFTKIQFKRQDKGLPFFPEQAKSILKWTPLLEDMNEYGLKVTGLKAGKYDVKLGDKTVANYTDAELAKGVNLAGPALLTANPVADQVKDIVKAVTDKTSYYHDQIYSPLVLQRGIDKNPDFKDVAKEDRVKRRDALIAERMQKMPELDAAIRKALEPRAHRVEIAPAKYACGSHAVQRPHWAPRGAAKR